MARIDFSDPQGGKGAADRLAATCKGHVRAFIYEGNDVCTAADLTNALLSHGGVDGVRVACLNAIAETPDESQSIAGITKLNNFEFSADGSLTCWRAYGVGRGKKVKPDELTDGTYRVTPVSTLPRQISCNLQNRSITSRQFFSL